MQETDWRTWRFWGHCACQEICVVLSGLINISITGAVAPFSLQSLVVLVSSAWTGRRVTAVALTANFLISVLSLQLQWRGPFTPRSWNTLGYILGFLPAGMMMAIYTTGNHPASCASCRMMNRIHLKEYLTSLGWNALLSVASHGVILTFGACWLALNGVTRVLNVGVIPFLPGMCVKSAASAILVTSPYA
mmetsp:Transcript_73143/g.136716  ORF Transcript_73143/g.136716 Transcript_73143/m.136716 type:complete len:191 (-) Transcript_73143:97-669(-)